MVFISNPLAPQDALAVAPGVVVATERHPAVVYLASLSAGSRRTMASALNIIAKIATGTPDLMGVPWHQLDYGHTAAIRSKLAEVYAPATGNRMLAALRGVLRTAFKLGVIPAEQMTRATSVEAVRGSRVPKGRAVTQGELRALFGICDPRRPVGARDAALLALLYAGGLRRAEVVGLELCDFDANTASLIVKGKGNKERRIFITNGALDAVNAWLLHRGGGPGPLLAPVKKGGIVELRRMTDAAIAERVRHLAKKSGVLKFSPHDMRRSFVGDLLDAGADIAVVQQLAGHASPTTTARYDRRGERTKQKAASLLHVPFGQS